MTFEMYPSGMIERFWTIEAVRPMRHLLHGLRPSHMLLFFWVLCWAPEFGGREWVLRVRDWPSQNGVFGSDGKGTV